MDKTDCHEDLKAPVTQEVSMTVKNEKYKRIFRFCGMIWIAFFQTAVFSIVWDKYYNSEIDQSFAMRGNWVILGLYLVILLLFTQVYGGFKIGYQKPGNLTLSQSIALIGTNVVEYLVIVLLSRNTCGDGSPNLRHRFFRLAADRHI